MTITIRTATIDDAEAIFAIHHESIHGLCTHDYTNVEIDAWMPPTRTADKYRNDIKSEKQIYVIAEIDGQPAGFSYFHDGKITSCYVHPDYARQGVATALFQYVEEATLAQDISRIWLSSSITALPFYRKMGMRLKEESIMRFQNGVEIPIFKMYKNLQS